MATRSFIMTMPLEWIDEHYLFDTDHMLREISYLEMSIWDSFAMTRDTPIAIGYLAAHDHEPERDNRHYLAMIQLNGELEVDEVSKIMRLDKKYIREIPDDNFMDSLDEIVNYRDPNKVLYDPRDVVSLGNNVDYYLIIEAHSDDWEKDRYEKLKKINWVSKDSYDEYEINDLLVDIHNHEMNDKIIQGNDRLSDLNSLHPEIVSSAFDNEGIGHIDQPDFEDRYEDIICFMLDILNSDCIMK